MDNTGNLKKESKVLLFNSIDLQNLWETIAKVTEESILVRFNRLFIDI